MQAWKCGFVALLGAFFLVLPAWAEVKVGFAGPLSGPVASYGQQIKTGVEFAIADINARGGLLGQKLVLIDEDDACEPKQAVNAANLLVKKKVDVVVGHWCAGSSIVAAPIYNDEGFLLIEPGSIWSKLTQQNYPRVFRMAGTELLMGEVAAKLVHDRLHGKSLVVLEDQRGVMVALGEAVAAAARMQGVPKAETISFAGGESDYRALLTKVKMLVPDVVYCSCYTLEAGLIARQAAEQGMQAQMIGPETLASADFLKIIGPQQAEKILALDYSGLNSEHPAISALQARLNEAHIDINAMMSFYAYAGLEVYAGAVREAGTLDPVKVAAGMHEHAWNTVLGPVSFAANGDRQNISYSTFIWRNGALREDAAIK